MFPAVILPTIWRYLQTLEAAPYFLGLVLSAFSLSGLLTGPLFGYWSDQSGATKKIILFANCFEMIGESSSICNVHHYCVDTVFFQQHQYIRYSVYDLVITVYVSLFLLQLFALQVISCTLWATPSGCYCQADWWQVGANKITLTYDPI